jgi:hypothetical protein
MSPPKGGDAEGDQDVTKENSKGSSVEISQSTETKKQQQETQP